MHAKTSASHWPMDLSLSICLVPSLPSSIQLGGINLHARVIRAREKDDPGPMAHTVLCTVRDILPVKDGGSVTRERGGMIGSLDHMQDSNVHLKHFSEDHMG